MGNQDLGHRLQVGVTGLLGLLWRASMAWLPEFMFVASLLSDKTHSKKGDGNSQEIANGQDQ